MVKFVLGVTSDEIQSYKKTKYELYKSTDQIIYFRINYKT